MALRDSWHKALVYFGLAEEHDYGPDYEEDFDPETGTEEAFESRRERERDREPASVRRLPTSRRARRDEIDDIFGDDEPIAASRTRTLRPVDNGGGEAATSRSTWSSRATSTTPSRSPISSNGRCR